MVFVQKLPFFQLFFFLGNIGQENVFYDILERKNACLGYETGSLKSPKVDIFPKGLTHGFHSKMAIFFSLFFQAIQYRKMSFMIFQQEKRPFQAVKTRSLKSRKVDIFRKRLTHGFFSNMAIFSTFLFLGNIGQENVFYDILERKNVFLGYKNKKFKKSKN